jgi:hypothetical protein
MLPQIPRLACALSIFCCTVVCVTSSEIRVIRSRLKTLWLGRGFDVRLRLRLATTPSPSNESIKFRPRYLTSLGPPSAVKATPISLRYSSPPLPSPPPPHQKVYISYRSPPPIRHRLCVRMPIWPQYPQAVYALACNDSGAINS